jgi:hypothetical protein
VLAIATGEPWELLSERFALFSEGFGLQTPDFRQDLSRDHTK